MEKIIYEVCPHCGSKNKCYKYPEMFKGKKIFGIKCNKLNGISRSAEKVYKEL